MALSQPYHLETKQPQTQVQKCDRCNRSWQAFLFSMRLQNRFSAHDIDMEAERLSA